MPLLTVANAAMFMVYMGIGVVLLPVQVELIDPADKVADFGLVSGVAAIFATLFNSMAGLLSDRSGRRNPWILCGGLAALFVPADLSLGYLVLGAIGYDGLYLTAAVITLVAAAVIPIKSVR
ncbi:hypothetical protein [Streptomyces sp. NPDC093089]|uniref:hypothetical protein n=1 Tax=Streptomyces sp. NPDC093089 TaxID=3366024 RepID=UPI00382D2925